MEDNESVICHMYWSPVTWSALWSASAAMKVSIHWFAKTEIFVIFFILRYVDKWQKCYCFCFMNLASMFGLFPTGATSSSLTNLNHANHAQWLCALANISWKKPTKKLFPRLAPPGYWGGRGMSGRWVSVQPSLLYHRFLLFVMYPLFLLFLLSLLYCRQGSWMEGGLEPGNWWLALHHHH